MLRNATFRARVRPRRARDDSIKHASLARKLQMELQAHSGVSRRNGAATEEIPQSIVPEVLCDTLPEKVDHPTRSMIGRNTSTPELDAFFGKPGRQRFELEFSF